MKTILFIKQHRKIAAVRASQSAFRYGRLYFRPVSGDGIHFGISKTVEGILAYSRILSDEEVVIVANTSVSSVWEGDVLVDYDLNARTKVFDLLYCNHEAQAEVRLLKSEHPIRLFIWKMEKSISDQPGRFICG